MGNFFKAIGRFFKNHFGNAPTVLQTAQSILGYIGPLLGLVMADVAPQDAAEATNVLHEVQVSLGTASAFIAESHSSTDTTGKQRVATALNAVVDHVNELLAAGHIKNPGTIAKVTAGVQELQAVVKQLTAA
jgi:hypothetical protein